jgi:PAS domain-containing protein
MPHIGRAMKSLLGVFRRKDGDREAPPAAGEDQAGADGGREVESMLETFRGLMAQLSQDGMEIGQICARAEKKAARYARLSETVVESVTSGILVVDETGRVLLVNSSAKGILDFNPGVDVTGMDLSAVFKDGGELVKMVESSMATGVNASRNVREIVTLAGRRRKLGVSASCVGRRAGGAEAVILVFTSLGDEPGLPGGSGGEPEKAAEEEAYLRGVFEAYDLISGVVTEFDKLEQKSNRGILTKSELMAFSSNMRGCCDIMMALALSLRIGNSIPELVDINGLLDSLISRSGLDGEPRLRRRFADGLPRVKTVRKALDAGLALLVRGCLSQSVDGVEIATLPGGRDETTVALELVELSPSRKIFEGHASLREIAGNGDIEREAGIFLLSRLPGDGQTMEIDRAGGLFHFSMKVGSPIDRESGDG